MECDDSWWSVVKKTAQMELSWLNKRGSSSWEWSSNYRGYGTCVWLHLWYDHRNRGGTEPAISYGLFPCTRLKRPRNFILSSWVHPGWVAHLRDSVSRTPRISAYFFDRFKSWRCGRFWITVSRYAEFMWSCQQLNGGSINDGCRHWNYLLNGSKWRKQSSLAMSKCRL